MSRGWVEEPLRRHWDLKSGTDMVGKRLAWMPLAACMMALPSCNIPDLRGPCAGQNLPETFNGETSEQSSALVPVEEFFTDPILMNLINQGLAGNQELMILGEDIQIANNEVFSRRGA